MEMLRPGWEQLRAAFACSLPMLSVWVVSWLAGGVPLLTGSGDAERRLKGVHERVFALSAESAREVIQVDGPDHGASKAVLQQPLGLRETVGGPAGALAQGQGQTAAAWRGGGTVPSREGGTGEWLSCSDSEGLTDMVGHRKGEDTKSGRQNLGPKQLFPPVLWGPHPSQKAA